MAKHKPAPKRDPEPYLEDIRDDCIAIFLNTNMTQEEVHQNGGPTPTTISRWLYKETRFPQFATVRSLLKACGADLVAVSGGKASDLRHQTQEDRLDIEPSDGKPTMPKRQARRKAARKEARRGK